MGMGGASDQIFVFKALTSSIGLFASDLLMQGFELCDRVIRFRPSFTRLSPPRSEAFLGLSSHSRLVAHRLASSRQGLFCKALTSESGSLYLGLSSHSRLLAHRLGYSLKTFFYKALTASKPASESRLTNTGVSLCEVILFMVLDFATNISQHLQENHTRSPSGRRYLRFFKIFPNL